ncbi:MAG: hypothetical protein GY754_18220 [bacterium]|nr:hypothetical protein [bacterium]
MKKLIPDKKTVNFTKIFSHNYSEIFMYINNEIKNPQSAADLTRDVFLNFFSTMEPNMEIAGTIQSWLFGSAQNMVYEYSRKGKKADRGYPGVNPRAT